MTTTTENYSIPAQKNKRGSQLFALAPFLLGSVGIGLAVAAQYQLIAGRVQESLILYAGAVMIVLTAFFRQPALAFEAKPAPRMRLHKGSWLGALMIVVATALTLLALPSFEDNPTSLTPWWLHLGSIALFLGAVFILDRSAFHKDADETPAQPWQPIHLFLLATIVAIGAFFRFYRFSELPFGTWYDEAEVGLQAIRILDEPNHWPVFVGAIHGPAHYIYLVALSIGLFGVSTESIRAVSAVMGILTIPAAYLVGRELFDRRTGLVLAFLIAVSSWAVNFSRIGMHSTMTTPLFALLSVGFLLRGLRRQKLIDYALAGIFLALGLCFYTSFRLVIPAVGLFGLYCLIAYPFLIRRSWLGLLVLSLGMALLVAPLVMYAYHQPDIFWARVQDTYLLANKASEERLPVLIESIRKHLFMFNYIGDPNGRHNLPGEPMLDPILGAWMVLGFFLSLRWIWRPAALLLPLWLGISLLGGILSLDFEAPQSLRANGALPVAYIFAVVPIFGLWQEWRKLRFGRRYPRLFVWPLLAALIYVGYINYEDYFERRAGDFASWNAFSTPESIAATLLQEQGDEADFFIISFFHGHPTINFLARDRKGYGRVETTDQMPLRRASERDIVLILNAESRSIYDETRRHYPTATFEEIGAPFGGPPVVFYARLTPEDMASIQGLTGHYYANEEWDGEAVFVRKDSTVQFDWTNDPPLTDPFSVEWMGVLNIERYGPYRLILRSPAAATLYLNEETLLEGSGELSADVVLAKGNHALRLRAVGGDGPLELAWQSPGSPEETIPRWALYVPPVSNNGLLGRYYPNGNWQSPEAFARIDPRLEFYFHVPMLPRPYTVEWIGKIFIAQSGLYRFGLESIDESILYIDDQEITAARVHNQLSEGSVTLSEGLHDIRVLFADRTGHTHINLYWSPPGRGQSHVPAEVLFPPQGSYDRINLEAATDIFRVQTNAGAASLASGGIATVRLNPVAAVAPVALNQPRALAVAPAGGRIYVADAKQMLILDERGKVERRVDGGAERFTEISDMAVAAGGEVYVLDAGRARLSLFTADGVYLRDIPTQDLHSGRSRGIFIDDQNRIWIANTPNGQIVALDQNGNVLQVLPVVPGSETQPVDLLVTANGTIYVTDVASNQLVRIRPELNVRDAWTIPVANSVDGPHLAQDSAGNLYMTMPEQGVVLRMGADGEDGIEYALPRQRETPPKPVGIGAGSDGRVWVVDGEGSAVISFTPVE